MLMLKTEGSPLYATTADHESLGVIAREARRISTIAAQSKISDLIENGLIL